MEAPMKREPSPGMTFESVFTVTDKKTVPQLYPEFEEFQVMPRVLATGFMVGLIEWACIRAINPYLEWPKEQTVGTRVELSHTAATPPGLAVRVRGRLDSVEGRKLVFSVTADDGVDEISSGRHERHIILADRFNEKAESKQARAAKP
jgi:fluoroacetyl-CoA thioesterase